MAYVSDTCCRTCCSAYTFNSTNSSVYFDSSDESSLDYYTEDEDCMCDTDMSNLYQNGFRNSSIYAAMEQNTYKYSGNSFQKFYDERTEYLSNKFNNLSLANDMNKNHSACPVHSKTSRKPMNKYTLEESYWAMWKPKNKTESNTNYLPSMPKVESINKTNVPMPCNVNMGKYMQCQNCFKFIERDNNQNYSTKCLCCAHKEFYETDTDSAAYRRNGTIQEDDEEETETQGYSGETTGFMTSEDYLTTTETQDYSARNQSDQSRKSKRKSSAASSRPSSKHQSKTETILEPKVIESQSGIISPIVVNQAEIDTWEQPELEKHQKDYQQGDSRNLVNSDEAYYDAYHTQNQYEGNYNYSTDNYHNNNESSESAEYASTTKANYNYNVYNQNPNQSDTNASNTMNTNITNTATPIPTYNSASYYDTQNTQNTNNVVSAPPNTPNNYRPYTPQKPATPNNHAYSTPTIINKPNTSTLNQVTTNPNLPASKNQNYPNNPNVFKFSAASAIDAEVLNESEIKTVNYEPPKIDPNKEMITLKHTNSYIQKQKAEQAKVAQSNTINAATKLSSGNRVTIRPHSYPLKPILKKDKKAVAAVRTTTASKNFGMKYKK